MTTNTEKNLKAFWDFKMLPCPTQSDKFENLEKMILYESITYQNRL